MINKTIDGRNSKSQKKKAFENSWSVTYRKPNYDALGDPHASYYFLNKSMRKHLSSLRKVSTFNNEVHLKIRSFCLKEKNTLHDLRKNKRFR